MKKLLAALILLIGIVILQQIKLQHDFTMVAKELIGLRLEIENGVYIRPSECKYK